MDRGKVIRVALQGISAIYEGQPMVVVEVGCAFQEDEGFSTYLIADFLMRRQSGGKLYSVDIDEEHIKTCKKLIRRRNPAVLEKIEFRQGYSVHQLPEIINEIKNAHLFYLDGGAHPEACLYEFEIAQTHLADNGLIIVDDAQFIDSKPWFPDFPLPFGKATLTYPYLIISNYLKYRSDILMSKEGKPLPASMFMENIYKINTPHISGSNYAIIGNIYWHAMLLYGNPKLIEDLKKETEKKPS